jgi:hypothetical protein
MLLPLRLLMLLFCQFRRELNEDLGSFRSKLAECR